MNHCPERKAQGAEASTQVVGKISRRAVVAGIMATTAVVAVLPLSNSVYAEAGSPGPDEDMVAFLFLSQALTGVDRHTLAPEFQDENEILDSNPGDDPINIKNAYFDWLQIHAAPTSFSKLLQIARDNRNSGEGIISKVTGSDDDTKYLARSIVLLWYLGSWYEPRDLKTFHDSPQLLTAPIRSKVVSGAAYTQGLVWSIAGAHPMGYSNLQFGYWSRDPHDPNGPKGQPLPLFTPSGS